MAVDPATPGYLRYRSKTGASPVGSLPRPDDIAFSNFQPSTGLPVAPARLLLRGDVAPALVEEHPERVLPDRGEAGEDDRIVAIVVGDVEHPRVARDQHVALVDAADMEDEGFPVLV